jgi:RNA polymerase sigma-70 factor (sigma-E family)
VSAIPSGIDRIRAAAPATTSSSFDALFDAHYPALMRFAVMFTGDRLVAEDVVADVFARLLARRRPLQADDVGAYLRRCVVNEARSQWRRQERRRRLLPGVTAPRVDDGGFAGALDERERVLAAIARLPDRQRAVVVLRFYEDRSEAETAELLGMAVGTVKSTLWQARRRLQALLEGADDV